MADPERAPEPGTPTAVPPGRAGARPALPALALWILLVGLTTVASWLPQPPAPRPTNTPPTEFSAERARVHVEAIAREPRPHGSAAHARARQYIVGEFEHLGLKVRLAESTVPGRQGAALMRVTNILARWPGTGGGKAVMLATHYDSADRAPGASDAGSGVATLIETARALAAAPRLTNDVIFLVTDAEERGLHGAEAFVRDDPWRTEAGLVLNFEARGHRGPVYMFETSRSNGWLIAEYARAAERPLANSLMYEVYQRLPNDTDLSVFKRAGLAGLNFAIIAGVEVYHTPNDDLAHLELRSLQHYGANALRLTRHFGNLDLTVPPQPNVVYFDLLGAWLVHYPAAWVWPLTGLATAAYVAVLGIGLWKRRVTWGDWAGGVMMSLVAGGLVLGLGQLTWAVLRAGVTHVGPLVEPPAGFRFWLGAMALAVAASTAVHSLCCRKYNATGLALGCLLGWLIELIAITLYLPGGSYLFLWPLLAALAGLAVQMRGPRDGPRSWLGALGVAGVALPGLVLLGPCLYRFHVAFVLPLHPGPLLCAWLLLTLLVPAMDFAAQRRRWLLPVVALAVAVALLAAGVVAARAT